MKNLSPLGAIGGAVRLLREQHGLTLDDVAREVRNGYGLSWSRSRVGDIENGRGAATVEVLVTLCAALSDLTGERITPDRLVEAGRPVEIGPGYLLEPEVLPSFLRGEGPDLHPLDGGQRVPEPDAEAAAELLAALGPNPHRVSGDDAKRAYGAATLADDRAAQKLGISKASLVGRSLRLWGRLLSAESAARAGEGATPQKRGRVTRDLLDAVKGAQDHGMG